MNFSPKLRKVLCLYYFDTTRCCDFGGSGLTAVPAESWLAVKPPHETTAWNLNVILCDCEFKFKTGIDYEAIRHGAVSVCLSVCVSPRQTVLNNSLQPFRELSITSALCVCDRAFAANFACHPTRHFLCLQSMSLSLSLCFLTWNQWRGMGGCVF